MQYFRWLSGPTIPPQFDLRRCGWRLAARVAPAADIAPIPALVSAVSVGGDPAGWLSGLAAQAPANCLLVLGIDDPVERTNLLRAGFGDVLGSETALAEVEARARRIAENAQALPRSRQIGRLRLDLFARDGFVEGRPLGLHPREFDLVWRLAETPGVPVAKDELMRRVWRLSHMPDTNSIAVHIFRLRSKLGIAGLEAVVQTAPSGGYFLAPPGAIARDPPSQREAKASAGE